MHLKKRQAGRNIAIKSADLETNAKKSPETIIVCYRIRTETCLVQRGWPTYRETYQLTYFPNGQVQTKPD